MADAHLDDSGAPPVTICCAASDGAAVREAADRLYAELAAAGVDVLLEDRDERAGVLFADMELIGVPHRVVISERGIAAGTMEYKGRRDEAAANPPLAGALRFLQEKLGA